MNVPAIEEFVSDVNECINMLLIIREDLMATDRCWFAIGTTGRTNMKTKVEADLVTAKAAVNALVVP